MIRKLNDIPFGEIKEWKGKHSFPEEGWAIFSTGNNKHVQFEVERIDELNILESDNHAFPLAIKKGYQFNNPNNPYEVTNMDEMENKFYFNHKILPLTFVY